MHRDALVGYTLACIIDNFQNQSAANAVEKLLKVVAAEEAKKRMADRKQTLPSHTFVKNYLVSFRGLEKKTTQGYEDARHAFEKAVEAGDLGEHEALAYNMRGTFRTLMGSVEEAVADLTKCIEIDPTMTQAYIKLASIKLEQGKY